MERRLKIGFVGCGRHSSESLLPALRYIPEMELIAVCDTDRQRAENGARLFGARECFYSIEDMLSKGDDIEAVIISVGGSWHAKLTIAALESGRHVLVEKPPAVHSSEAEKVEDAANSAGKHVMVAFKKRFCPVYLKAREIVGSEAFGAISRIDMKFDMGPLSDNMLSDEVNTYTERHRWMNLDVSVHLLDLARFLVGNIESVYSECGRNCTQVCVLTYTNGIIGTMAVGTSQSLQGPKERIEITGRGTSLVVDNQIRLAYYRRARDTRQDGTYIVGENEAPLVYEPQFSLSSRENKAIFYGGYYGEIRHFVQSILHGEKPSPDISDGIAALRVVEAMAKSVRKRVPVRQ